MLLHTFTEPKTLILGQLEEQSQLLHLFTLAHASKLGKLIQSLRRSGFHNRFRHILKISHHFDMI